MSSRPEFCCCLFVILPAALFAAGPISPPEETVYEISGRAPPRSISPNFERFFRPYDEATSQRIDYGNNHPWEERQKKRRLRVMSDVLGDDNIAHQPIRIHFHTDGLNPAEGESEEKKRLISLLKSEALPGIAEVWSSALSVVPVQGTIAVPSNVCGDDLYSGGSFDVTGADLVIIVTATAAPELGCIPGSNSGTLAVAGPCAADQWDRPVIGFINFCLETAAGAGVQSMIGVGAHEVGHVLGFAGEFVRYFRDSRTGEPLTQRPFGVEQTTCVDGSVRMQYGTSPGTLSAGMTSSGVRYFEVTTPRLATVARNQFNCPTLKGARLENQPTSSSCFGGHLDERLYFTELMGPVFSSFANALSPLTLAFFEDSGWYVANYSAAVASTFGLGAGCEFVSEDCIKDGEVPSYSKGFFCNDEVRLDANGYFVPTAISCDPSRTHKAVCNLADLNLSYGSDVPEPFQYFENDNSLGALMPLTDYCPVPALDYLDCQDPSNSARDEYYGADSRCYDATVSTFQGEQSYAMCFKTFCNAELNVIEFQVGSTTFTCEYDGQLLSASNAYVECPRFAVVCPELICPGNCAGRGVCNWDAVGGPRCECFDAADTSPDCFGSAVPTRPPSPELFPTKTPTVWPTKHPSALPTKSPTARPAGSPISSMADVPSVEPSARPLTSRAPTVPADGELSGGTTPTSQLANSTSTGPNATDDSPFLPPVDQSDTPSLEDEEDDSPSGPQVFDGSGLALGPSSSSADCLSASVGLCGAAVLLSCAATLCLIVVR